MLNSPLKRAWLFICTDLNSLNQMTFCSVPDILKIVENLTTKRQTTEKS